MSVLSRVRSVTTGVAGTPWWTNMYFTGATGSPDDLIDAVRDFWTSIAALLDNALTISIQGDVALVESDTDSIVGLDAGTELSVLGTDTGAALPPANQALVHWLTDDFTGGRQLRGRTFIPGITVNEMSSVGVLLPTPQTTIRDAANALVTAAGALSNELVIYSRRYLTFGIVTATSVPTKFAVLRSRRD